jgi:RimJ/RimL family protein N-acetyltransferase
MTLKGKNSKLKAQPEIETERLILRPFRLTDAPDVMRLAGDRDVAVNTLGSPHPYEAGMAEEWIGTHQKGYIEDKIANFAVVIKTDNTLVGAVGLEIERRHQRATIGYWIGKPYWKNGYAAEAAGAVVRFGFEELGLNRISAGHFKRNPASGRVMQKIGMKHEGTRRKNVIKWGEFQDMEEYAILKSDFESKKGE